MISFFDGSRVKFCVQKFLELSEVSFVGKNCFGAIPLLVLKIFQEGIAHLLHVITLPFNIKKIPRQMKSSEGFVEEMSIEC